MKTSMIKVKMTSELRDKLMSVATENNTTMSAIASIAISQFLHGKKLSLN